MSEMLSPNEVLSRAKDIALDGNEPTTKEDWAKVVAIIAINLHPDVSRDACQLMAILFEMPLSTDEVDQIVFIALLAQLQAIAEMN